MKEDRYRRKSNIPLNGYDNISSANSDEELIDSIEYSRVINKLIHIIIYTRSNIAFAFNRLAQFISNLAARYSHEVKTLLRYLRLNSNISIVYRENGNKATQLIEYSNINYAINKSDRKCIIKQIFMLNEESISWANKKQRLVSTSIMKTEYITLSECFR